MLEDYRKTSYLRRELLILGIVLLNSVVENQFFVHLCVLFLDRLLRVDLITCV